MTTRTTINVDAGGAGRPIRPDLLTWRPLGPALDGRQAQEGPTVLQHGGSYWMAWDWWSGLLVYRSDDLTRWTRQRDPILAKAGSRPGDGAEAHHAMALAQDDAAYLVYFTHPGGGQRSCVQIAPLEVRDGRLICHRDTEFDLELRKELTVTLRGGDLPT